MTLVVMNNFFFCRRESHDRSKKHEEKVRILRKTLLEEDELLKDEIDEIDIDDVNDIGGVDGANTSDEDNISCESEPEEDLEITKSMKKKKNKKVNPTLEDEDVIPETSEIGKSIRIFNSSIVLLISEFSIDFR